MHPNYSTKSKHAIPMFDSFQVPNKPIDGLYAIMRTNNACGLTEMMLVNLKE